MAEMERQLLFLEARQLMLVAVAAGPDTLLLQEVLLVQVVLEAAVLGQLQEMEDQLAQTPEVAAVVREEHTLLEQAVLAL